MPINVNGRLWGMIAVGSAHGPMPPYTELRMMEFTDLLSTAIATAHHHAELMASRSRLVASADETRRRITRDLHDGAQQRLVTLALRLRAAAEDCTDLDDARESLRAAVADAVEINDELREITHTNPAGSGITGLRDRVDALGGTFTITSEPSQGTIGVCQIATTLPARPS
jgi:signal transduction histidine kinase